MTLIEIKKRYKKQGKDWREYKDDIYHELNLHLNDPNYKVPQMIGENNET